MLKIRYKKQLRDSVTSLTLLSGPDDTDADGPRELHSDGWSVVWTQGFGFSTGAGELRLPTWCVRWRLGEAPKGFAITSCYNTSLSALARLVARFNGRKNVCPTDADEGLLY